MPGGRAKTPGRASQVLRRYGVGGSSPYASRCTTVRLGEPSSRCCVQDWKSCVIAVDASRIWALAEAPDRPRLFERESQLPPGTRTSAPRTSVPPHLTMLSLELIDLGAHESR